MPEPYCFDIETLLNECRPASLLLAGGACEAAVEAYRSQRDLLGRSCRVERLQLPFDEAPAPPERLDMGIVTDTLEHLDKAEAFRLMARLRDLYTSRFCVAVRIGDHGPAMKSRWSRNDLLALGMMLVNRYEDDQRRQTQLYKYDIATYKPTPRWLSPENWANPELWNKYRW